MRIQIPAEISALMDVFGPYTFADENGIAHLADNAPQDAVEAKKKYDEWNKDHKRIKD